MTTTYRRLRRFASAFAFAAAVGSPLAAQAPADFSGKWVADPKSIDPQTGLKSLVLTVTQDAKTIKVQTAASTQMGDQASTLVWNVDGSTAKNSQTTPNGPVELTSTGSWEGKALLMTTKGEAMGQAVTINERWSMEPDGKTLHLKRDVLAMGQTLSFSLDFTKQ